MNATRRAPVSLHRATPADFYDLRSTSFDAFLAAVARGLEAALARAPELTGRLVTLSDGMLELHPAPGRGVPIHVAHRATPTLVELEACNYALAAIPDGLSLPSPFVALLDLDEVLVFHATAIPDGAVLGYSSNHLVMDGGSLFHFLNGAAALAAHESSPYPVRAAAVTRAGGGDGCGVLPLAAPPHTPPNVAGSGDVVVHSARGMRAFDRIVVSIADPVAAAALAAATPMMRACRLLFLRPQLAALKAASLAALTPAQRADVGFLSTNNAVVGVLWSAITRARIACGFVAPGDTAQFHIPVNVRPRLVPPMQQDALGNGTVQCWVPVRAGAVAEGALSGAALGAYLMRRSLALDFTDAKIRALLAFYTALPRKGAAGSGA